MRRLLVDVRYAVRTLRRSPLFAATAIGTLALGIGATTALFSVVNAVLLRPLPYREVEKVVIVWGDLRNRNVHDWPFSNPDFADLRAEARSFAGLAAVMTNRHAVPGSDGGTVMVRQANVTTNIFSVLGVRVVQGREFLEHEGAPPPPPATPATATRGTGPAAGGNRGAGRAAGGAGAGSAPTAAAPAAAPPPPRPTILSHEFWQRHFGADPGIVGRVVPMGNGTIEVVGILEPGVELLFPPGAGVEQRPDLWSPLRVDFTQGNRNNVGIRVVGRLGPGATVGQAQAEADGIAAELRRRFAIKETAGLYFRVEPIGTDLVADVRDGILALMGAVFFVLLIACANVANLLLVRSASRTRELAVRSALGAGMWPIVRQQLAESLVIAAAGALAGLVLAQLGIRLLLQLRPDYLPRLDTIAIDPIVLAFAAMIAVLSVVVFGLVPAIRAARPNVLDLMRQASRTAGLGAGTRLRSAVVVTEVVLSFVLLVGSGLMLRSFVALHQVDPGFDPANVLTFRLGGFRFNGPQDTGALSREIRRRFESLPGVTGATIGSPLPLDGGTANARYGTEAAAADPGRFQQADVHFVSPGYFDVLRTRVVEGRAFTEAENRHDARLVVIDAIVARKAFPGESAVGKRLLSRIRTDEVETFDVIGVVEHQRHGSLAEEGREAIYFAEGLVGHLPGGRWAIRTTGELTDLIPVLRAEVSRLPGTPLILEIEPMNRFVDRATARTRFALTLIGVFAIIAIVLAAVGLYSVLSTVIRLRTAEIGVRIAFGAPRGAIFRLMVGHGVRLTVAGLVVGTGAAYLATGALRSLLVGVTPTDPLTFAAVGALFLGIAGIAAGVPAWRAARLDPTTALRQE